MPFGDACAERGWIRKDSRPVTVVADDRENAGGLLDRLRSRMNEFQLKVRRLEFGDFEVGQHILVERKRVTDFVASVIDGRLFRQAAGLAGGGRRGVLILEGPGELPPGVSREAMQGALITVAVFFGVAVLRSRDLDETVRLLLYLGRQESRMARGSLPRMGYRPKGKRARQSFVLQGLPGIGPHRAEALLTRFGSIENITRASIADLAMVPGIGEQLATKIRGVLD